jgi:hypothetical protein
MAWIAALTAILSGGPFFFQKMFYHDQACVFFMMLALFWLNLFLVRGRFGWLYLFSLAAMFDSVTRPAMNLVFPLLLAVAWLFGPRPRRWLPYAACLCGFAASIVAYQAYRSHVFAGTGRDGRPSYTGEQVFYNAYINSVEYGVDLAAEPGVAMARVRDEVRRALRPTPRLNPLIGNFIADQNEPPGFAEENLLLPSVEALSERIWRQPNYEYWMLITLIVDDRTLLRATLEIVAAHPGYFAAYTLRGAAHFLFAPGYAHTRYNTHGYSPVGQRFYPEETDLTEVAKFPARAQAELGRPAPFPALMAGIASLWVPAYGTYIGITSILMIVGWLSALAAPSQFTRAFLGCFAAATLLLLYNALIVGAFVDPDYRYEAMVLVLRGLVAGFAILALRPCRAIAAYLSRRLTLTG